MFKILKNNRGVNQVVICLILVATIAIIATQISTPLTAAVKGYKERSINNITDISSGGF